VKITMSNDALASDGSYAGTYEISTDVNGKPSYTFGGNAIWYRKGSPKNIWFIGQISVIGSFGFIRAYDDFRGLTDERNLWRYTTGGEVNDIDVQCIIPS